MIARDRAGDLLTVSAAVLPMRRRSPIVDAFRKTWARRCVWPSGFIAHRSPLFISYRRQTSFFSRAPQGRPRTSAGSDIRPDTRKRPFSESMRRVELGVLCRGSPGQQRWHSHRSRWRDMKSVRCPAPSRWQTSYTPPGPVSERARELPANNVPSISPVQR